LMLDIAGTVWVIRDAYVHDPQFARLGLISQIENDGSLTIENRPSADGRPLDVPPMSRIVAIDGKAVPVHAPVWDVARLLERPEKATVKLSVLRPDGTRVERSYVASAANMVETGPSATIPRDVRIGARIAISLATCLALIACAALLYRRRARDPVA